MKLYVIKNAKNEYWDAINYQWVKELSAYTFFDDVSRVNTVTAKHGGHMHELVEKPKPVVLSKDEVGLVEQAKSGMFDSESYCDDFDFLITSTKGGRERDVLRAYYTNSYTVKPEHLWNVLVPGNHHVKAYYYKISDHEVSEGDRILYCDDSKFTDTELKQYNLEGLPREEVKQDE